MIKFHVPLRRAGTFAALLLATAHAAQAGLITFDFEGLPGNTATNKQVKTYLQDAITAALGPGFTINVTNAKGERNYNADGHVVGPRWVSNVPDNDPPPDGQNGSVPRSLTLGTSDGGVMHAESDPNDKFLVNNGGVKITMVFNFPIYAVSFDYEIFPNSSDPNANNPPWPDFHAQSRPQRRDSGGRLLHDERPAGHAEHLLRGLVVLALLHVGEERQGGNRAAVPWPKRAAVVS